MASICDTWTQLAIIPGRSKCIRKDLGFASATFETAMQGILIDSGSIKHKWIIRMIGNCMNSLREVERKEGVVVVIDGFSREYLKWIIKVWGFIVFIARFQSRCVNKTILT
jgi:hypothetical protein